ncbi:DUF1648 domain-containing protein [Sporosarcina ureilytica]|uniref:DUF1648 domain-containing protein n=1 Tax=Sporosarcina ureilytica TaxID=298596 RepID=A0A1D8JK05_9BACL|nr:DUF1648 domain-containing protein [Sporosarcina ureilytica]AOV09044.1 hypothetical protein BI350_02450 [Sporosarcina ureilytica]
MFDRPKLKLKLTPLELVLNVITIILFVGSLVYLFVSWTTLPNEVPAHYNSLGEVDRWGHKWEMVILPIIAVILWIGMTILEKYPHVYNYMNLTKENIEAQYLNGRLMVNVIKNIITIIFAYINWNNIQVALGRHESLGTWFTPMFFICIFIPTGYFIFRSIRLSRE